jgi:hypothetical protein
MIGHEYISVDCHAVFSRCVLYALAKESQIARSAKNGGAIIAALDDMQRETGHEEARQAGHAMKRMARNWIAVSAKKIGV